MIGVQVVQLATNAIVCGLLFAAWVLRQHPWWCCDWELKRGARLQLGDLDTTDSYGSYVSLLRWIIDRCCGSPYGFGSVCGATNMGLVGPKRIKFSEFRFVVHVVLLCKLTSGLSSWTFYAGTIHTRLFFLLLQRTWFVCSVITQNRNFTIANQKHASSFSLSLSHLW